METILWLALVAPVGVAAAMAFDEWCERRWQARHDDRQSAARDELWP